MILSVIYRPLKVESGRCNCFADKPGGFIALWAVLRLRRATMRLADNPKKTSKKITGKLTFQLRSVDRKHV